MSYKELADRLDRSTRHDAYMHAVIAKAIAILRSLDAQEPVAWMHHQGSYKEPSLFELDNDELARGWAQSPLYAAPVAAQPSELDELRKQKDGAYFERNQVVAALAKCFPSGVAKTAIEGWSEDWHGCVYIDLPTGQVSWHFHDSQAYLFKDLPPYAGKWDGHDTPEKYRRVNALAAQPSFAKGSWQHAVDDQLVGFGRTSQEFGSPHDAVRWLIEQEVQAAQPTREQAQRERMEARQWNAKAFNFPEYFAALQRAMQARNATPADVSRATGVSATTLTRMKEGRRPDAASLAALSAWAGLNPAAYVKASPATADFDLPAQSDEVAAQPQQANWQAIQEAQQRYLPLIKAAVDLIAQCHEQLEKSPAPQCYGVPYGHLNALRDALLHPSVKEMAAQPQQAKPLSDDGWQSISTAPKDGTLIIVREERCSAMAVMWVNGWKYESGNVSYLEPTHWMPLPPPPKD